MFHCVSLCFIVFHCVSLCFIVFMLRSFTQDDNIMYDILSKIFNCLPVSFSSKFENILILAMSWSRVQTPFDFFVIFNNPVYKLLTTDY